MRALACASSSAGLAEDEAASEEDDASDDTKPAVSQYRRLHPRFGPRLRFSPATPFAR